MFKPHSLKHLSLYMVICNLVGQNSVAKRRQVGTCIVTKEGMIAIGMNGQPSGFNNNCEWQCEDGKGYETGTTKPTVIHAERNALDKLSREGISPKGGILFTSVAPCLECAKSIAAVGIKKVYYQTDYHCMAGLEFLKQSKVATYTFKETNQRIASRDQNKC
jgi:dCMP deaminase